MESISEMDCDEEIDLIPILLKMDKDIKSTEISPSCFMSEMKLSTEERLEKSRKVHQKLNVQPEFNSNTFSATPDIVIFQNFTPGTIYSAPLTLRNTQNVKVSKPLRGAFMPSPYFFISYSSEIIPTHVAPGMAITFNIKFCADDIKDYKYQLVFMSEKETFAVPIIAVGCRPLLNLPDHINMPNAPIKMESQKVILVYNFGQVPAVFTIKTKEPFSVSPSKGILLPEKEMQLKLYFRPTTIGIINDFVTVTYETGEALYIKIKGYSENINIHLEKGSIRFQKTFMGLSTQKAIKLYNSSKHIVNFQWKKYCSIELENVRSKELTESLHFMQEHETIKYNKLEMFNIIDSDGHKNIYNRICDDELEEFNMNDKFIYHNKNFEIIPMTGEIWPESILEFLIMFTPTDANLYSSTAYLETTGKEERLNLVLNGQGCGPLVFLNLEDLDANNIYMCAVHQYEVAAVNRGDIPATVAYIPKSLDFGGTITCWPNRIFLEPNQCAAFVIEFSSKQQGRFIETIEFQIRESKEIIRFIFRGEIVCPLLTANVDDLDFGEVAIGYPVQKIITLYNHSMVPIEYQMNVNDDGQLNAINCQELTSFPVNFKLNEKPQEFLFSSQEGFVPPNSSFRMEITLTANIIRSHQTAVAVFMWHTTTHSLIIPVKYIACVPHILCVPSEINIRFCFVTYPYNRRIMLHNNSNFPGLFQLTPSMHSKILINTSTSEGFIEPYENVEIDLTIITEFVGEDKSWVYLQLFGDQPIKLCLITCMGQGPVVTINPAKLNFGKVTLLENTMQELNVSNDSPIVATILANSSKPLFQIEPTVLELPPETSESIRVSVYLCNPGKVQAKLRICVVNGETTVCPIIAIGTGTSILCEPKICPSLNIGMFLTHQNYLFEVIFTNKGIRKHKMIWSRNKQLKQAKDNFKVIIPSIFTFSPNELELATKRCLKVAIQGFATKPELVKEDFYCHAMIEKAKSQAIIMSTNLEAEFVDPVIEMSKNEMRFKKNVGFEETTEYLIDEVIATNKTPLPIKVNFVIHNPFYMLVHLDGNRTNCIYADLETGESMSIFVAFEPHIYEKKCLIFKDNLIIYYKNHPKKDRITVVGEVNFPHVEIIPNVIDFPCISENTSNLQQVVLKNTSPLPVSFLFEWEENSITSENVQQIESIIPKSNTSLTLSQMSSNSDCEDLYTDEMNNNALENEKICFKSSAAMLEENVEKSFHAIDSDSFTQENKDYNLAMKTILCGITAEINEKELNIYKTLPKQKKLKLHVNSLIDFTPTSGFLNPYESQVVMISFHPTNNILFTGEVKCHVAGGLTESLNITAVSSEVAFSIDQVYIDFGKQMFCHVCERTVTLTNIGYREFQFMASTKAFPENKPSHFGLEAGCISVIPRTGILQPKESAKLKIQYFPGIAGEFDEKFLIEIGYLPPVTVVVHGYGIFPQIHLSLPRPNFDLLNQALTYLAVASLTSNYVLINTKQMFPEIEDSVKHEDMSKYEKKELKMQGWVIISNKDLYPSIIDINLAIERIIFYQYISFDSSILLQHTKHHKAIAVPQFQIPSYLLDLGYVILDTVVHHTVVINNFCPLIADVAFKTDYNNRSEVRVKGLAIRFQKTTINPGGFKELNITFHPTPHDYPILDEETWFLFYFDVGHGPRIPVDIKVVVTVPIVSPKVEILEFEEVRCGDCFRKPLVLYNRGYIVSEWSAVVKKPNLVNEKKPAFFLRHSNGVLQPGCGCALDIYFEPQNEDLEKWKVIINVEQNPGSIAVKLRGLGLIPRLSISEEEILFNPILPYAQKCEKRLNIKNISSFPIEFYFADYDKEIDDEEKIINILNYYYMQQDLYIPPREAGSKLPLAFIEFYHKVLESLREKLILIEKQSKESNATDGQIPTKESSNITSICSEQSPNCSIQISDILDPIADKTQEELDTLLKEHLEGMRSTLYNSYSHIHSNSQFHMNSHVSMNLHININTMNDPVYKALVEAKSSPVEKDPTDLHEGVFIVFYGAPNTNLIQVANKAGLDLHLPVYNIDQLLIESLANKTSLASIEVNEIIDSEFRKIASETDLLKQETCDDMSSIQEKIDLLLSGKKEKPKSALNSAKGSSKSKKTSKVKSAKGSSKSKKKSKSASSGSQKKKKKEIDTRPTFLGISEELIWEVLKERVFIFKTGVVIESLTSVFIRQPLLALNFLLKAIGNIQYIHFIILSQTYKNELEYKTELNQLEEKRLLTEKHELLRRVCESDIDFNELTTKERETIREFILERKLKTLEKIEALKTRLLEKKLGLKATKYSNKHVKKSSKVIANKKSKGSGDKTKNEKKSLKGSTQSSKTNEKKGSGDKAKKSSKGSTKSSKAKEKKGSGGKAKKSPKGSTRSSKAKNKKAKLSPEEQVLKLEYDTFEFNLQVMLHTLEFWDRKACILLKPLPAFKGSSKGKEGSDKKHSSKGSSRRSPSKKLPSPQTSVIQSAVEAGVTDTEQDLIRKQKGIPCWLFNNARAHKPIKEIVSTYLQHTLELSETIEMFDESLQPKIKEVSEMFTVLHTITEEQTKHPSNVFVLLNQGLPVFSVSSISKSMKKESNTFGVETSRHGRLDSRSTMTTKSSKRKCSFERKKGNKPSLLSIQSSRISTSYGDQLSLQESTDLEQSFNPRVVLNPGETCKVKVLFIPEVIGKYENSFTIKTVGWHSKFNFLCKGQCDIPTICMNPQKLFSKVAKKRLKKNMYLNNLYFEDLEVFDVGPLLVQDKEDLKLSLDTEFYFENCSSLTCDTNVFMHDDTDAYQLHSDLLIIEPLKTEVFKMTAIPILNKDTNNQLIISVKNNPKVELINVMSNCCKLEFTATPTFITFERIPITQHHSRSVFLQNQSPIGINWKIISIEEFLKYFGISKTMGYLAPKSTEEVLIHFCPEYTQNVPNQAFEIKVYDKDAVLQTPLYENIVEVVAEAVEIKIEYLKEFHLHSLKGRQEYIFPYTLLNKGKYNVQYIFSEVQQSDDNLYKAHNSIRSYFKIAPKEGTLQTNKMVTTKLTFFARKAISFRNVPILKCTFNDPLRHEIIETFLLTVSGQTYLPSFELCPPEQVNFGYQLVGAEKAQEMDIVNNGRFDFSFQIISLTKYNLMKAKKSKKKEKKNKRGKSSSHKGSKSKSSGKTSSTGTTKSDKKKGKTSSTGTTKSDKKKGKASSSTGTNKSNKKKVKITKLDFGIFSLVPADGVVAPNSSCKVCITSRPKHEGVFEETLLICISGFACDDKDAYRISVSVNASLPHINFDDMDKMFREMFIVNRLSEFKLSKETDAYCIFIREDTRVHFSHVLINNTLSVRIRLENLGPVSAQVATSIVSNSNDVFSVEPSHLDIDTLSAGYVTVSFSPSALLTYNSILTIVNDHPSTMEHNKIHLNLSGEGIVPQIALTEPQFNTDTSCYAIDFNPIFSGNTIFHTISFENIGIVSCQVIIEVCTSSVSAFTIVPLADNLSLLEVQEQVIKKSAHTNITRLNCRQHTSFELHFKPSHKGFYECVVKLYVVNNPFETFMIFVTGKVFEEDIMIEGLPTYEIKEDTLQDACYSNPGYILDFENSFINVLQKKCFKIINNSSSATYKFEFFNCDKLMFIPAIGHLKPNSNKDVFVVFLCKEPLSVIKEVLECTIYQIEYVNADLEPLSWDDRQSLVIWEPTSALDHGVQPSYLVTSSRCSNSSYQTAISQHSSPQNSAATKTIKARCEPLVQMIPNSQKIIPIELSVICDYSSYCCSVDTIELPDTLAFETQWYSFEVTNTSNIPLSVNWNISLDESYPKRINSAISSDNKNMEFVERESYHSYRAAHSANDASNSWTLGTKSLRPIYLTGRENFIATNGPFCTSSQTSLFSSEAHLSNRSSDSWIECDYLPFFVVPQSADIQPQKQQTFKIMFSPKDVFSYLVHLKFDIPNLHFSLKPPNITVKARSLLPLYHFDIAPSDYLAVKRQGKRFCRDLADENTRVLEFEAVGLGVVDTRFFNIINPTGESFSYKWIPAEINHEGLSLFHCHKPQGFIEKGKMDQATFSFFSQSSGTFEAFYRFYIKKYNLSRIFLLAGVARELDICFTHSHIQMKPTIIGIDVTGYTCLKNNENLEVDFKLMKNSLYSEAHLQVLTVSPMTGILQPHEEQQFKIVFHPIQTGEVSFNLKCSVERMKKPLSISVIANCFELEPFVFYNADDGSKIILELQKANTLVMKGSEPHLTQTIDVYISNIGVTGFYYMWSTKADPDTKVKIDFSEHKGYIRSKNDICTVISVTPLMKLVIKKLVIKLEIAYGPTYEIHLEGSAANPLCLFSFISYDFGACLIQKEKALYNKKILEFTNNEEAPITLECKLTDDNFTTIFVTKQVKAKNTEHIVFYFHPYLPVEYYAEAQFFVNSKLHVVKLHGIGVNCVIELLNPLHKFINFGSVPIGQTVAKTVTVINKSEAAVEIFFDFYESLPCFSQPKIILKPEFAEEEVLVDNEKRAKNKSNEKSNKKGSASSKKKGGKKGSTKGSTKGSKKGKNHNQDKGKANTKGSLESTKKDNKKSKKTDTKKNTKGSKKSGSSKKGTKTDTKQSMRGTKKSGSKSATLLTDKKEAGETENIFQKYVKFFPKSFACIAPQQSKQLTIKYSPMERMKLFSEKVHYQVQDCVEILCELKGCCTSSDFVLEKNLIHFGSVIKGCCNKQKVALHNTGDNGASFKWVFGKHHVDFLIVPMDGYIATGTSVTFTVSFKPLNVSCLLETKATCIVEGFSKQLDLCLKGISIDIPAPKEHIKFVCPVRETQIKQISIHNPTGQLWTVYPILNGQYFETPGVITVHARTAQNCDITYKPLTMSHKTPHEASVFFSLPEGRGLLYSLIGTSELPLPMQTITQDIPSKTFHSEILIVRNWLNVAQTFIVLTENTQPQTASHSRQSRPLYKLMGDKIIDVLPQSEKNYTWTIYALSEGELKLKVLFKNEKSGEYLFYNIILNITKSPVLEVINLTSCIHVPKYYTLKLQNPIKQPVQFSIRSPSSNLTFESPVTVAPYSEGKLVIKYDPLVVEQTEASIEIITKELGNYLYNFILTAHSPIPEPCIRFTGSLGETVSQKAFLSNESLTSGEFTCQIDHPDVFFLEKTISASPKCKTEFEVFFEPNVLGVVQSTLTLSSSSIGTYIYPLIGTCTLPQPKGPYFIKPGGSTSITFKNPFDEELTYEFFVEPAIFTIKSHNETLNGRKHTNIVISLVPLQNLQILIDQKYPITGKLVVYSNEKQLSNIKWMYYLQEVQGSHVLLTSNLFYFVQKKNEEIYDDLTKNFINFLDRVKQA